LKPKSHKSFFEEVANEVGVHKDVVEDIIGFYYANIRKSLSNLSDTHVSVSNLGTFKLRKKRLEKNIKRNKDIIGNLEKMTYKGYDKYVPVKNKLKQMQDALCMLNEKINLKKKFKNENK
jgi:nucleoid DNA-binding protein|tara:strand:+ start:105 stop:464 length:360 start_codon:yes stop_codon:yes gene_type:complete